MVGFVPGDCLAGKLSDFTKGVISPAKNGDFTGKHGESTIVKHSEALPSGYVNSLLLKMAQSK